MPTEWPNVSFCDLKSSISKNRSAVLKFHSNDSFMQIPNSLAYPNAQMLHAIKNVAGYKLLQILHHNGAYLHWKIGALFVNFNLVFSCQHIQESLLAINLG